MRRRQREGVLEKETEVKRVCWRRQELSERERESSKDTSEHNIGTPYHSSHYCLWFSYYCTVKHLFTRVASGWSQFKLGELQPQKCKRVYWRIEGTSVLESLPKMSEHYIEQ